MDQRSATRRLTQPDKPMDRTQYIKDADSLAAWRQLRSLHAQLGRGFEQEYGRSLPFADELFDRWERARSLGFGAGTSIYDSALVFGAVTVGEHVWIGPQTIIDGSGGLTIGDHCTISTGVHLYTHDNVKQTLTGGKAPIERSPISIGRCTYIGPNTVVQRGVSIGSHCVIGVGSFVNHDLPDNTIAVGTPARVIGRVVVDGGDVRFDYADFKEKNRDESPGCAGHDCKQSSTATGESELSNHPQKEVTDVLMEQLLTTAHGCTMSPTPSVTPGSEPGDVAPSGGRATDRASDRPATGSTNGTRP